jgi:hypothetical protein
MPRRRPDGGVATPRWIVAFAVAVSIAVHVALIWGNFAIYKIDLSPKKGERYLMVGQLVKGLPDEIPIPVAAARVPVSSSPATRSVASPETLPDALKPQDAPEETEQADQSSLIPTPTPSVLSWDMAEARRGRATAPQTTVRQGVPASGVPVLDYRQGTGRAPDTAPDLREAPQASIPRRSLPSAPKVPAAVPQKAPRIPKKWTVTISSFIHEEYSVTAKPPSIVYMEDIPFPEEAKQKGIEDHVIVDVQVGVNGKAEEWHFARGKQIFRANVIKALKAADFEPAKDEGGRKVSGSIALDIHFLLQEER